MRVELQTDPQATWLVVGGRRWPTMYVRNYTAPIATPELLGGKPMESRGCGVRVESGWDLSIIWGHLTYSSNQYADERGHAPFTETPEYVEVGIIKGDDLAVPPFRASAEGLIVVLDWIATVPTGDIEALAERLELWS